MWGVSWQTSDVDCGNLKLEVKYRLYTPRRQVDINFDLHDLVVAGAQDLFLYLEAADGDELVAHVLALFRPILCPLRTYMRSAGSFIL
jgi:hypothetical protein